MISSSLKRILEDHQELSKEVLRKFHCLGDLLPGLFSVIVAAYKPCHEKNSFFSICKKYLY